MSVTAVLGEDRDDSLATRTQEMRARLSAREKEVQKLQAKLIALHEEARRES